MCTTPPSGFPGIPLNCVPSVHFVLWNECQRIAFWECAAIPAFRMFEQFRIEKLRSVLRLQFSRFQALEHQIIAVCPHGSAGGFLAREGKKRQDNRRDCGFGTDILVGSMRLPAVLNMKNALLIASAASPNPLQQESC